MGTYHGRTIGLHDDRQRESAIAAFLECREMVDAFQRAEQIESLPVVQWKGRTLYTIRCQGTRGKGPHDCHVPERILWSLIDFRAFRCAFHFGD